MSEEDFASESESDEESNFDSEASAEASDDEVSDEEEGEDWDELEKKAARKDREGGMDDEERKPAKGGSKKR
jgi:nucleosome binding factor SPN SPT16 subunit